MSEPDNKEQTEENPNITKAQVEEPPKPDKRIPMPKSPPKLVRVENALRKTVTYINEFGKEFEATPTESFPIGSIQGKEVSECKPEEVIHHLEYIENGIKKVVRSVHHINTRPKMADESSVCVWK